MTASSACSMVSSTPVACSAIGRRGNCTRTSWRATVSARTTTRSVSSATTWASSALTASWSASAAAGAIDSPPTACGSARYSQHRGGRPAHRRPSPRHPLRHPRAHGRCCLTARQPPPSSCRGSTPSTGAVRTKSTVRPDKEASPIDHRQASWAVGVPGTLARDGANRLDGAICLAFSSQSRRCAADRSERRRRGCGNALPNRSHDRAVTGRSRPCIRPWLAAAALRGSLRRLSFRESVGAAAPSAPLADIEGGIAADAAVRPARRSQGRRAPPATWLQAPSGTAPRALNRIGRDSDGSSRTAMS